MHTPHENERIFFYFHTKIKEDLSPKENTVSSHPYSETPTNDDNTGDDKSLAEEMRVIPNVFHKPVLGNRAAEKFYSDLLQG